MKWKIDQHSTRWWYSCVLVCMTILLFLCFPFFVVFYLLLLTLIHRKAFLAWFLTAVAELKLELWLPSSIYWHLSRSSQWWPRVWSLAVHAGCVSQDRVCGHWVRSVSFCRYFLWLRQWEWSEKLEAAAGGGLWPAQATIIMPSLIPGKLSGKERTWVCFPLVLHFYFESSRKHFRFQDIINTWWLCIPLFSPNLSAWCVDFYYLTAGLNFWKNISLHQTY